MFDDDDDVTFYEKKNNICNKVLGLSQCNCLINMFFPFRLLL